MFQQIVWWSANAAQIALLVRSVQGRLYTKYFVFYLYLSSILLVDVLRFSVFFIDRSFYRSFYWNTQLFSVLIGYAVIVEIYRLALADYPRVARLANVVLVIVFVAMALKVTVGALTGPIWSPAETTAQLERNLRAIQAVLLVVVVGLLNHYAIPLGRNLKGIIVGYSFYVSASVISLAFGSDPLYALRREWRVQPIAYLVTLFIWCATLWSYQPNPQPKMDSRIERDYESLARQTARLLSRARSDLIGAIRP